MSVMFIRFRKSLGAGMAVDCVLFDQRDGGIYPVVISQSEEPERSGTIPDQVSFSAEAAQAAMDDLWDAGIRPKRNPASLPPPALLVAKEKHIDHLYELAKLSVGAQVGAQARRG